MRKTIVIVVALFLLCVAGSVPASGFRKRARNQAVIAGGCYGGSYIAAPQLVVAPVAASCYSASYGSCYSAVPVISSGCYSASYGSCYSSAPPVAAGCYGGGGSYGGDGYNGGYALPPVPSSQASPQAFYSPIFAQPIEVMEDAEVTPYPRRVILPPAPELSPPVRARPPRMAVRQAVRTRVIESTVRATCRCGPSCDCDPCGCPPLKAEYERIPYATPD